MLFHLFNIHRPLHPSPPLGQSATTKTYSNRKNHSPLKGIGFRDYRKLVAKQLRWWRIHLRKSLCFALCFQSISLCRTHCQANDSATVESVKAMKQFLDNPPNIESMVFERVYVQPPSPDWGGALNYLFQIKYQRNAYFLRTLQSHEEAGKKSISKETMMASRFETNCWSFANGLFEHAVGDYGNNFTLEDPINITLHACKRIVSEVMHLGMTHVKPGTLKWNEDSFEALSWDDRIIVGEITFNTQLNFESIKYHLEDDPKTYFHTYRFQNKSSEKGRFLPTHIEISTSTNNNLSSAIVTRSLRIINIKISEKRLDYDHYSLRKYAKDEKDILIYTNKALFAMTHEEFNTVGNVENNKPISATWFTLLLFVIPTILAGIFLRKPNKNTPQ
jgi:hypothetical protein